MIQIKLVRYLPIMSIWATFLAISGVLWRHGQNPTVAYGVGITKATTIFLDRTSTVAIGCVNFRPVAYVQYYGLNRYYYAICTEIVL